METELYKISLENFETILAYYNIVKDKAKKYYNYIIKYKEYTNNFYSNIKQLFSANENISEPNHNFKQFEKIEIDLGVNKTRKSIGFKILQNNNINNDQKKEKKINIMPIQKSINRINKFLNTYMFSLNLIIESLESPLKELNQYIEETQIEINNIKNDYLKEKEIFLQKYSEFEFLNKKLASEYEEGEEQLVKLTLKKKSLNDKDKENEIENEINLKLIDVKSNQKDIIDKYKSFNKFVKNFNDSTNQKVNEIKIKTSSLFEKFDFWLNNLLLFYKKSFLIPINEIPNQENIQNIDKTEFDDVLNSNIQKIDENLYNINFDQYQIKIINANNNQIKDNIYEGRKSTNSLNDYEIVNNNIRDNLDDEDILYIVKKMYNFDFVNKKDYIIKIEKEKLKLKEKIDKLTSYSKYRKTISNEKNTNNPITEKDDVNKNNNEDKDNNLTDNIDDINKIENNEKIKENYIIKKDEEPTEEDIKYICKLMPIKEYRLFFLTKINNFRALGAFMMPENIFNYIIQIFKEISKYLCNNEKNDKSNEKKEIKLDMETIKLAIILSQTFYCKIEDKKIYIQNKLNNETIYHNDEFWKKMIKFNIENEIKICKENDEKIGKEEDEETIINRRNNISFAQIIPQISGMHGFGLNKEKIKNIILPFIEEYNTSEENKNIILNIIDNPNYD